ncbi:MAG: hypothetical protein M1823_003983 [Watsoniomyces obsoletus]|nr:MAG: hypothetical protein M1823_003983 [Watsoniomyces obsoletus]
MKLLSLILLASQAWGTLLDVNNLRSSYDYVIVGCGISGLVIANRLSEDNVTVLCIEAGDPDQYEEFIQVPQFVGTNIGSKYDWKLSTEPQTYLDGATRPLPLGKVLGGGSILNAMCWNRGGIDDFDSWRYLGNPGWGWDELLPYFIKSETYTPVHSAEIAERFSINHDPAMHGFNGPVHVSYPRMFYPQTINFFSALNTLGVPTAYDPNDGTTPGASLIPTALHPVNQTRSDARRTYYDPYATRSNLHIITGHQATRLLIDGYVGRSNVSGGNQEGEGSQTVSGGLFGDKPVNSTLVRRNHDDIRITGVEFSANASAPRNTIAATREVIVTAGAIHSPQLLQLSGIGPRSLLQRHDIPVALDLPGVGRNLQDHWLVGTFYPYNNVTTSPALLAQNVTLNDEARREYYSSKTGPWTAGSPNGVAFPSLADTSNLTAALMAAAASQPARQHLVAELEDTVVNGYAAQKDLLAQQLASRNNAAWEILNNNIGSLSVALMRPFSRGSCEIKSADPFEPPSIDPRYGSNPVDLQILVEALKFNRRILATPQMQELRPAQFVPPIEADDDALMQVVKTGIRTEYHPSGTCAMMPVELGGVVDPSLRVYGTRNLRVADAGIFPLIPAAHLMSVVYAVAEKAADIIKADNKVMEANDTVLASATELPTSNLSTTAVLKPTVSVSTTLLVETPTERTDAAINPTISNSSPSVPVSEDSPTKSILTPTSTESAFFPVVDAPTPSPSGPISFSPTSSVIEISQPTSTPSAILSESSSVPPMVFEITPTPVSSLEVDMSIQPTSSSSAEVSPSAPIVPFNSQTTPSSTADAPFSASISNSLEISLTTSASTTDDLPSSVTTSSSNFGDDLAVLSAIESVATDLSASIRGTATSGAPSATGSTEAAAPADESDASLSQSEYQMIVSFIDWLRRLLGIQ